MPNLKTQTQLRGNIDRFSQLLQDHRDAEGRLNQAVLSGDVSGFFSIQEEVQKLSTQLLKEFGHHV